MALASGNWFAATPACGRQGCKQSKPEIIVCRVALGTLNARVVNNFLKNEDTWCKILADLRSQIRYNLKCIFKRWWRRWYFTHYDEPSGRTRTVTAMFRISIGTIASATWTSIGLITTGTATIGLPLSEILFISPAYYWREFLFQAFGASHQVVDQLLAAVLIGQHIFYHQGL